MLLAELRHERPQMFGLLHGVRAPDGLEDRAMRQDAVGISRQQRQQLELLRRQANLLAGAHDAAAVVVDREIAGRICPDASTVRAVPSAQRDANPRQQLLGTERFRDVVIGAEIERADLVCFATARRQHDDRHRRRLADARADFGAVEIGQAEIQHHQVGACLAPSQRALPRRSPPLRRHSRAIQQRADRALNRHFVVHQQNLGLRAHRWTSRRLLPAARRARQS